MAHQVSYGTARGVYVGGSWGWIYGFRVMVLGVRGLICDALDGSGLEEGLEGV